MEKGDDGDDSDVLPLSLSMSSRKPFDLITQPVLQPDKETLIPHCHCDEELTPGFSPKRRCSEYLNNQWLNLHSYTQFNWKNKVI